MKFASIIAFGALLVALPAAAQLHRCKDKAGKTTYQDQPCEGTAAGRAAPAPAAGASGAAPPPDYAALSLWETTMVYNYAPKPLTSEEMELAGMNGFLLGRPEKTVVCTESPVRILLIESYCEKQIAVRGGVCRTEEPRGPGQDSVMVITGDFRSRFHVEQILTTRREEGTNMIARSTSDYRYLGACKPGMQRHSTLWVNAKGEWITEAQMAKEVDGAAQAADQRLKDKWARRPFK